MAWPSRAWCALTNASCLSLPLPSSPGAFNLPTGCATGTLGVSYDKLFRLTFNSPQVPILAVITKDPVGSLVSYFGTGSTQVSFGGKHAD